jgi:hypothetical protein
MSSQDKSSSVSFVPKNAERIQECLTILLHENIAIIS